MVLCLMKMQMKLQVATPQMSVIETYHPSHLDPARGCPDDSTSFLASLDPAVMHLDDSCMEMSEHQAFQ